MTKSELSAKLNELLELEIEVDFKKLTGDDLERLYLFLSTPKNLIEVVRRGARGRFNEDVMNMTVKDILEASGKEEGPLGFGLLAKAKERIRRTRE